MSKMLLDEHPLLVGPTLAKTIGLNEAIVLQQIHYWLVSSDKVHEGRTWTYNTYEQWQEQMPWWSERTIRRILDKLREMGLVIVGRFNKMGYDKTNWYTIDYDRLDKMASGPGQNGQIEEDKVAAPIPKTSSKTSSFPASSDAGNLPELEYVPLEGDDDYPEESERPRWQIPETDEQKEFLAVCGARWFKIRQKTKVKALLKSLCIGDTTGEKAYVQCADELEGHESLPQLPFCIPRSWYEWRTEHAQEHRWSVDGFIKALMNRDALVKHCQYHLKRLGMPVPEESYEDHCRRRGWTEVEPGVWEDKR